MSVKKFSIRAARKTARIGSKVFRKSLKLTKKVEDKATRILDGTDFSIRAEKTIPIEKIYYNSLPYITPLNPALPAVGSSPTVTLLLPSLDGKSFFGGTATALVAAGHLAKIKGRKLRIVQTLKKGQPSNLIEFFKGEGLDFEESDIIHLDVSGRRFDFYGYLSMHQDDIFVASAWWDAYLLNKLPLSQKFIYLVQDYEPIFYNNSDLYILAESTYHEDSFIPLCNTKLMFDFMREKKYPAFTKKGAQWFEPAVSRIKSGKSVKKSDDEKKRLFIYGRPDVHRNLFFSAIQSVDMCFKLGYLDTTKWEVVMAGQDNIPNIKLSSGVVVDNLGKLSLGEYESMSKTIDIALSPMMAPHPNYPTLEFSSIGAAVVTTKYESKQELDRYSKNIFMSDPSASAMAEAIKKAADLSYEKRLSNLATNSINTDWQDSLQSQLQAIIQQLDSKK